MPEGDTIHKLADELRPRLLGRTLRRVYLRDRGELREACGKEVRAVEAYGKHLLLSLEGELNLRVHLGMHGRMRHYPSSAAPSEFALPLLIATADDAFTFPRASQVELFRGKPQHSDALARLGPDLLSQARDLEATLDSVVMRARAPRFYARELGDVLLDQTLAAGVGNVLKSEALFLCRQNPFVPVGSLDDGALRAVYARAAGLMRENVESRGKRRVTVRLGALDARPAAQPNHWVYGRAGEACMKCGTAIAMRRQGETGRSTYHCPACQQSGKPG